MGGGGRVLTLRGKQATLGLSLLRCGPKRLSRKRSQMSVAGNSRCDFISPERKTDAVPWSAAMVSYRLSQGSNTGI